jgi:hypothetical protein
MRIPDKVKRIRSTAEAVSVSRYVSIALASGPFRSAAVGKTIRLLDPGQFRILAILGYRRLD